MPGASRPPSVAISPRPIPLRLSAPGGITLRPRRANRPIAARWWTRAKRGATGCLASPRKCYAWGMSRYQIARGRRGFGSPATRISLFVVLVLLLFSARSIASYAIEIAWWKELGQFRTWLSMLYYSFAPLAAATLAAFGVLWLAHARALK